MANVSRLDFGDGVVRKLKCRHKYMREARNLSGRGAFELVGDPLCGWAYIVQALLQPGSRDTITLDRASELIDLYSDTHNDQLKGLGKAINEAMSAYLSIEMTPTAEEADEAGTLPNPDSPAPPGPSAD